MKNPRAININKEIAVRVKGYRKKMGYSQENIADMIGVTRVNYVNMEAGKQNWKTHYLFNLCRVFNCRPSNLFPKIEPVKPKSKITTRRVTITRAQEKFLKV
jgi:DNA-binding XRE family transcriptional regulator